MTRKSFKTGPKLKLDDEIHDQVVRDLERGVFLRDAAILAGVLPDTLRAWVKKGLKGDPETQAFAMDVKRASAVARNGLVGSILDAGKSSAAKPDWRATAWVLEKMDPKVYATRSYEKTEQKVVSHNLTTSDPALLAEAMRMYKEGKHHGPGTDAEVKSQPEADDEDV